MVILRHFMELANHFEILMSRECRKCHSFPDHFKQNGLQTANTTQNTTQPTRPLRTTNVHHELTHIT